MSSQNQLSDENIKKAEEAIAQIHQLHEETVEQAKAANGVAGANAVHTGGRRKRARSRKRSQKRVHRSRRRRTRR
jgi:hypothetical protein